MAEAVVEVEGLAKRYGTSTVFESVSLRVKPGESVAIVGESGVGKSTLLAMLAEAVELRRQSRTRRVC